MRDRMQIVIGEREPVLTDDVRPSVAEHLDDQIERLTLMERNELDRVQKAVDQTVGWFDRVRRASGSVPFTRDQADEVRIFLNEVALDSVAKWNARELADELAALQSEVDGSGLNSSDQAVLRARAAELRGELEHSPRYRREHDDTLLRLISLIKEGNMAWAERNLLRLEQFIGRHRWWL